MFNLFNLFKHKKLSTKQLGDLGEKVALKYLQQQGYKFVAKNWKIKIGEIDLIMFGEDKFIFVEVKTRYDSKLAKKMLFENITSRKLNKLKQLSINYLIYKFGHLHCPNYRIDVIAVLVEPNTHKTQIFYQKGW
ncbi:MAG: YraN family protein [Deltaproteobacteria bacterium]|jgi:putative endonuclease|nr:YraN family protein [Deltaproteobacteria bacterium]